MVTSPTDICNSALIKVGAMPIASLSEDNKPAIVCNTQYAKLRDELLAQHPWNFALRRAELANLSDVPTWGYDYAFQLPVDCLRVIKVDDEGGNIEWKVEGRTIVSDESDMSILYVAQITDVSYFPPVFVEALALRIAADLSYIIAQNTSLQDVMMKAFQRQIALARSMDAQEGTSDQVEAETWLNARN